MKRIMLGLLIACILALIGTGTEIHRQCAGNCIPLEDLCLPVPNMPDNCVSPYAPGSREVKTIQALWRANCGGCVE